MAHEIKMTGVVSGNLPVGQHTLSSVEFQDPCPTADGQLQSLVNGFNILGAYAVGTPVEIVVVVGEGARFSEPCPFCVAANKDLKDAWRNIREGKLPNGDERTSG